MATAGRGSSRAGSGSAWRWPAPSSTKPKVLLLDEPLGALDLKLREQMQEELKALQKTLGITFVFVTHDQGEALSMADRVAVFNDGRLHAGGHARGDLPPPQLALRRRFRRLVQHPRPALRRRRLRRAPLGLAAARGRSGSAAPTAPRSGLTGTVASRSYLGGTIRLGIDVDGTLLHAVVPAAGDIPVEGELVNLGFPATPST